jgi:hypothetical protein
VFFGCARQNESHQIELGIGMNFISHKLLCVAFTLSCILFGIATTEAQTAATPYLSPEDGGPRNWSLVGVSKSLNLHQEPSDKADVAGKVKPGDSLDNLGCQLSKGQTWCDVQPLGGGPRGYVSARFLKPAVSPDGSIATGIDDSALRAGQGQFDIIGPIPCAINAGQPMGSCEFGVARSGGGYATLVIKKPDGNSRSIYFRMGKPIGANSTQAEGYAKFQASKKKDLHIIRVGNERYEVPDAVIFGG